MGGWRRSFIRICNYRQLFNILPIMFIILTTCFLPPQTAAIFHKIRLKKLAKYGILGAALLPRYVPIGIPVHHGYGGTYDLGGHGSYGLYGGAGGLEGYEVLGGEYENFGSFGGYGVW